MLKSKANIKNKKNLLRGHFKKTEGRKMWANTVKKSSSRKQEDRTVKILLSDVHTFHE
jgi:hypothetical protein